MMPTTAEYMNVPGGRWQRSITHRLRALIPKGDHASLGHQLLTPRKRGRVREKDREDSCSPLIPQIEQIHFRVLHMQKGGLKTLPNPD